MQGKYFQFREQRAENGRSDISFGIFGHWYFYIRARESLALDAPLMTHWVVGSYECKPRPVSPQIEKAIREFQNAGRRIDSILIDPDSAGCLYLEGKLSPNTFRSAQEEKDSIIVTVEFNGNDYKVIIRPKATQPFAVIPLQEDAQE